ncbi:MAG: selenocysteine-specific translation elongation factor [Planctomycetota bacterium]|jgi:selenocysteine-specific elongation factor
MKRQPPGKFEASGDSDLIMMVCTAGHVDHGKTSLVKQLTGCNTDRLKVERERGLTIELGFAPCMLRGNLSVGIVDVPGHEKFVKNMVSGVPGIDLSILVIAADDGVMPQTVEHLQIMELLGVRSGIVALTKIDLVSEDRMKQRISEIEAFLHGTFLEGAPICPVSSETFDGFFDFYDLLVERVKEAKKARANGIFRMPIERTFSQQGFGVILSGIPLDGQIQVGQQIEVIPGGHKGKIRGIQCFGRNADRGGYGQCLALNIPDLGKINPQRGQVACIPGYLKESKFFHVRLKTIPNMDAPLKNNQEIKFHTGTSEELGKLFLLEDQILGAGKTGIATIAVQNPVAAAVLDKFILRRHSPATTVAGGEILAVSYTTRRPRKKRMAARLRAYQIYFEGVDPASQEGAERRIEYHLFSERKTGAPSREIGTGTLLPHELVLKSLRNLVEQERLMILGAAGGVNAGSGGAAQGDYFIHQESYRICLHDVEEWIKFVFHEEDALSLTMSDLRKRFDYPSVLWQKITADLEAGDLVAIQGNKIVLKGAESKFDEEERRVIDGVLKIYQDTTFKSPRPDEIPPMVKASQDKVDRAIEYLCNEARLVQLNKNVILDYDSYKKAQDTVVNVIKEKGSLNSADFKYHIESTRKYALAILDYLDGRRITICLQNHDRRLTQDYERNLL